MKQQRAATPGKWMRIAALTLAGIGLHSVAGWSQPPFSPATEIYKATIRFSPGSSRLSQSSVRVLRDVVKRAEKVQNPRIWVTVDGGDEVRHASSPRLRKSQGEAIVGALKRAGVKDIPVNVEGIGPNQQGTTPPGRRSRAARRETTVAIWDVRGG